MGKMLIGGIAALVIGVAIYGSLWAFSGDSVQYAEAETIAADAKDFKELSKRFEELAREKGGVYAFEVLRRATLPPNTDTHLLGHAVGDVFYTQVGVGGIKDCTQDFRNACSHTIVIGALNEYGGEEALALIRDACKKAPGGSGAYTMCYHGLGHGVFAFFSYEFPETVEFCKKTGTPEYRNREYIECVGGSIMELMGGGGHDREAWEASRDKYLTKPLSPCMDDVIPYEAKSICLVYLTPHIWKSAGIDMGNPDPKLFPAAFATCDTIDDEMLRNACYDGFGKEFPVLVADRDSRKIPALTDQKLSTMIEWCSLAPLRGEVPCMLSVVHSLFWGGENDPSLSFRFCSLTEGTMREACDRDLAQQVRQYLDSAQRAQWCSQLPETVQSICSQ